MNIAAVVLAAGASSRLGGGNKLISEVGGVPIIRRVLSALDLPSICEIVLVTASASDPVAEDAGRGRWRVVANAAAASGIASSIRAGLDVLLPCDGAMIVLGDMPFLDTRLVQTLCDAFDLSGINRIVYPQDADGHQGNPVIWPGEFFDRLKGLSGDEGAKHLIAVNPSRCWPVLVTDDAAFLDVDTRDDLLNAQTKAR